MINVIKEKIEKLKNLIETHQLCLPVFVRFQTSEQYFTGPVDRISINETELTITHDSLIRTLNPDKLVDVVAFKDSANMPVFLIEFDKHDTSIQDDYEAECEEFQEVIESQKAA